MDSSFFFTTVAAAAIGLFTLLRKIRIDQGTKEKDSSSSPPSSSLTPSSSSSSLAPSSSLFSLTPSPVPPSSSSRIWTHHVFPSFRGEDVRQNFLSHILVEFHRKGITVFIDDKIKRGESIAPELIRAIRESRIAVILLSRNYASSKWCLDELVEIMKGREDGQTVLAIFYRVDPSDVKKLTGDFGRVFKKTCAGKPKEDISRWKEALEKVATVAGYHSSNWNNEAAMIKDIVIDISNILNNSTPSSDFDGLVGMRAHLEKMEPLLCLDSDEVRMIGIWGPPGIGKTTIARVAYNQFSNCFQLSVFMENFKANYTRLCSDDYTAKLKLQQQFMSQITDHKDMKIPHLGVAQDRLKDKKVLVVLDGVDHLVQLDAVAKETWWFGPGSRILITAQDWSLFRAHNIKHIYKVDFPEYDEALQIFCMYAFDQKFPKEGFEELARKVTELVGKLPLGLRVMGSYFRGMSMREWIESLPRLESSLDADIQSILKFSYDALDDENKELFLHIACFFNNYQIKRVEEHLGKEFRDVRQRLYILADKSLISFEGYTYISMHSLLVKLGRDIVRKQHIRDPGQRQFLVDERDICKVLTGDAAGSQSVIGIDSYDTSERVFEELDTNERAFEGMSNLQFLRLGSNHHIKLPRGLKYISRKLQLLDWSHFPMSYLPSIVNVELLVELIMPCSKLEKLWDGSKGLPNLKRMDLNHSKILKEIPDLSTATNLESLDLRNCSSLVKLPLSIGNATNLEELDLYGCSNLVETHFPIGNLQKLKMLRLQGCSKLEVLPTNINLESLEELNLNYCSKLKSFPEISTNVYYLMLSGTAIEEVPHSIGSWPHLEVLSISNCRSLKGFSHNSEIQEVSPISRLREPKPLGNLRYLDLSWCGNLKELPDFSAATNLWSLDLWGCSNLQELPSTIGNAINLETLYLSYCSNLMELPPSIGNLQKLKMLILRKCSRLEILPTNINLESLEKLDLTDCSMLKSFPEISTNIIRLCLQGTAIEEVPPSIGLWPRLDILAISYFENLKEFPHALDIITELDLSDREIQEVPPFVKTMSHLNKLVLKGCKKLVSLSQIPDSVSEINAEGCSSLVELPPSIENLQKLETLILEGCTKLEVLPTNINLESLKELNLNYCSKLKSFPEISTNVKYLKLSGTAIEEVPLSIGSWPRLSALVLTYFENLKELPHALDIITRLELSDREIQEVPPCVKRMSRLKWFSIEGCRKLISLPQFPDSLLVIDAEGCESLERLDCSFHNPISCLNFAKCFNLNQEARDLIIHSSKSDVLKYPYSALPGREVPPYFSHRATLGDCSVTIKLNERPFHKFMQFKACFWMVYKGDDDTDWKARCSLSVKCESKLCFEAELLREHLYIFEVDEIWVTSSELVFDFSLDSDSHSRKDNGMWEIGEFGLHEIS